MQLRRKDLKQNEEDRKDLFVKKQKQQKKRDKNFNENWFLYKRKNLK